MATSSNTVKYDVSGMISKVTEGEDHISETNADPVTSQYLTLIGTNCPAVNYIWTELNVKVSPSFMMDVS